MSLRKKRVGTVLPMTSLVSKTSAAGTFATGEKFIDWLVKTHQTAWQILPLHQTQLETGSATKHIPSPYKGYGIGLDPRFLTHHPPTPTAQQLTTFMTKNYDWLENYALFCALRDQFKTDDWSQWPLDIKQRRSSSLKQWQKKLASQINSQIKLQAQLHLAYQQLHQKATQNGILLIGDLPLYLGLHSPLVWQFQNLFDLDKNRQLQRSSGITAGPKSHFGRQIWGHPLYNWQNKNLIPKIAALFNIRLKYLAQLFDWVRLDHAKGLFLYAAMDLSQNKADRYLPGPGATFLEKIIDFAQQQNLSIYAEDTGDHLAALRACLHMHQIPGIKIFKYAYDEKRKKFIDQYLKIDQYQPNTFAYTTTHDTQTLMGYLKQLSPTEVTALGKRLKIKKTAQLKFLATQIISLIIHSPAKMVLIPLQDWLYTTERINIPGTETILNDPNWQYQMSLPIEDLPTKL